MIPTPIPTTILTRRPAGTAHVLIRPPGAKKNRKKRRTLYLITHCVVFVNKYPTVCLGRGILTSDRGTHHTGGTGTHHHRGLLGVRTRGGVQYDDRVDMDRLYAIDSLLMVS